MDDSVETKRKRGSNYTATEKELLLTLVHNYIHVIENKELNASLVKKKRETWEQLTKEYNDFATSGARTWQQLRHLYDNLKQYSKKNNAKENGLQYYENMNFIKEEDSSFDEVHPYIGDIEVSVSVDETSTDELPNITPKIEGDTEITKSFNGNTVEASPSIVPKLEVDIEMTNSFDATTTHEIPNRSPNIEDGRERQVVNMGAVPSTNDGPERGDNSTLCTTAMEQPSTPKENSESLKKRYFESKLRNAKLEARYFINKNKRENNLYKLQLEILKTKLNKLKGQRRY